MSKAIQSGFTGREGAGVHLNISPNTLDRWRSEKKGPPYYKFGGAVRYKFVELDEYAESQRKF